MEFKEIIEDMKADVAYAVNKGFSKKAIDYKLNRVNDLIAIYNKQQQKITALKVSLEEAEMEMIGNHYMEHKMIDKFFLIFEMIDVAKEDVVFYLRKSVEELKENVLVSNASIKNAPKKMICDLFGEKYFKSRDFENWYFLNEEIEAKAVADNCPSLYIRLKKRFGAYNK